MEDYDKISVLGRGSFGLVTLCRRLSDNQVVVVKQIDASMNDEDSKVVAKEVSILCSLRHRHIVRYFDSFVDPESGTLCIAMEWGRGGSLETLLTTRQSDGHFTQDMVLAMLAQLCQALAYLHLERRLVHRDVCARNVLLCGPSPNHLLLKLCDFGVSKILHNSLDASGGNESGTGSGLKGSLECLSPEQCLGLPYMTSTDVWALGCLLYRLITLKHPFPTDNVARLTCELTGGGELSAGLMQSAAASGTPCESRLVTLMASMLSRDPQLRPTALDLLRSPLILAHTYTLGTNLFAIDLNHNQI